MEQGCPTTARLIPDEAGLKLAIPPDLIVLLVPLLPILPAGEPSAVLRLSHPLSQVTLALFCPLLLWVHGSRCVLLHQFLVRAGSALLKQGYLSQLLHFFLCTSCVFSKPLGASVQQQVSRTFGTCPLATAPPEPIHPSFPLHSFSLWGYSCPQWHLIVAESRRVQKAAHPARRLRWRSAKYLVHA